MKAARFRYRRGTSVRQVLELLQEDPEHTKILAGGQSLGPMLNLRLARPRTVVDVSGLSDLAFVQHEPGSLRLGALATHAQVEHYPGDLGGFEVVREACRLIGFPPVREIGTVGGSIAHADPTAEWLLVATLLDAYATLCGPTGTRQVQVADLVSGPFTTSISEDEMLIALTFPRSYERSAVQEVARQDGDFALASAAVALDGTAGRVADTRVAVAGVASVPVRVSEIEEALRGQAITAENPLDSDMVRRALRSLAPSHREAHLIELAAELVGRCATTAFHQGGDRA